MNSATNRAPLSRQEATAPALTGHVSNHIIPLKQVTESVPGYQDDIEDTLEGLPQVATVNDVAGFLGIAPNTVRSLLTQGKLPGTKVGRHWFIPRAHLAKLLGLQ